MFPLQVPMASPSGHLCFWPADSKSEVSAPRPPHWFRLICRRGSKNSGKQLRTDYQFVVKGCDEGCRQTSQWKSRKGPGTWAPGSSPNLTLPGFHGAFPTRYEQSLARPPAFSPLWRVEDGAGSSELLITACSLSLTSPTQEPTRSPLLQQKTHLLPRKSPGI